MKLDKNDCFDIIRGTLLALAFSMIYVFVLAVILTWTEMPEKLIMPLNIIGKIISVLLGTYFGFRELKSGLIKGLFVGILFSLTTYLVYSIVNKDFSLTAYTIYDILAAIVSGIVSGIIVVNLKSPKIV